MQTTRTGCRSEISIRTRRVYTPSAEIRAVSVTLEVLHRALVLLRGGARPEGSEISALAGFPIELARVEPVFSGAELADHAHQWSTDRSTALPQDDESVCGILTTRRARRRASAPSDRC